MPLSLSKLRDGALSVAGLTDYIQLLLEADERLRQLWVIGEVSSAKTHASGCFFSLQEPDGSATVSCVVWRSQLQKLSAMPAVGEQVIVLGQVRLYPKRGSYQLSVWQVLPAGDGLKALRYRQLRQRLTAEGLFDRDRKRALPPYVDTVAVVTSPQAAAWGDIQRTLLQRHPGLHVLLSPAVVQGEQAPASIEQAVARAVRDGRAQVLLLARGGGATEDLDCFDDERVVRAIATCPIPVVTGIGHERDESLADLSADICAHTPTAAAEAAIASLSELRSEQIYWLQQLMQCVGDRLQADYRTVQLLHSRLQQLRLDRQVAQEQKSLAWQQQRLQQCLIQRLQQAQQQQQRLRETLAALDPDAVLRRGYALVRQTSGAIATQADTLAVGELLSVQLAQGQLYVRVADEPASEAPPGADE
ncbi:MAG: exodeoxyribonuclease VII large subunit [Leptolyngbya sp. SIO4C1]|nr:exodeoxyribonuclease VII large subunit [Leptolyngbya sp. SIO4C1]